MTWGRDWPARQSPKILFMQWKNIRRTLGLDEGAPLRAAYDDLVPGFEALFEASGQDWQRFYDAVRRLAELPKNERHQALKTKS